MKGNENKDEDSFEENNEEFKTLLRHMNESLKLIQENDINSNDVSSILYDLAYIHFLKGNAQEAFNLFGMSVESARDSGNIVGQLISKCVQYRAGFIGAFKSAEEFKNVLDGTLNNFQDIASRENNENAKRWVKNVYAHLFEVLNNEPHKAKDVFESYLILERDKVAESRLESLSGEYLEYSKVLLNLGKKDEAASAARIGLSCADDCGNKYFYKDLQQIIDSINSDKS